MRMPYLDFPPLAPASSRSSSPKLGHEYESLRREPVRFVCSSDVAGDMEGVVQRDALRSHCSSVRNSSPCVTLPISSRSVKKKKSNKRRYIRNIKRQRQYSVRLVIQCALSRINAGKYNRIWIFLSYSLWSRCYVKHFFNLPPIRIFCLSDLGWDFASPSQSGSKSLGKWALVRSSQHKNWKREWPFVVRVNSLRLTTLLYNTDWICTADRYHFSNLSKQNLSNLCFRQAAWRQSLVLLSGPTSRHHTHKNK